MTIKQPKEQSPRSHNWWLLLAGLLGLVILVGIYLSSRRSKITPLAAPEEPAVAEATNTPTEETTARSIVVDDDGRSLWVSPTAGEPISLKYLPQGTQLVLHLRTAEMLSHPEGEKVFSALGPWGEQLVARVEQQTGASLAEVESLTIAVYPTLGGQLHTTWRLRLIKPVSDRDDSTEGNRAVFFPAGEKGKVLVSCPVDDVAELREQGDVPTFFARDLQRLFDRTDEARTASLVFAPRFLQSDGHKLLVGGAKQLEDILVQMLGAQATAMAISAHWGENFFLELQSTVTLDQQPHRFGANIQQWIPGAVDALQRELHAKPNPPYGKQIVARLPAMLRFLAEHTRGEEVDGVSVLRCYLPVVAGHNLLTAAELVINRPGSTGSTDVVKASQNKTLDEKLQRVTSLSFSKETLERALELLADDLEVEIKITGRDLQLEGITKNQSFGIELREKPAAEILLAIVQLANPDRTATGPADDNQKLVYVVDRASGAIVVTTRAAATRRGDQLPEVFLTERAPD